MMHNVLPTKVRTSDTKVATSGNKVTGKTSTYLRYSLILSSVCSYGFNEDTFTIYDVTDRSSGVNTSTVISRTPYYGATYTHQGWLLDESWQQYLFSDDELDEVDVVEPASDGRSVMYIW